VIHLQCDNAIRVATSVTADSWDL